MDHSESVHIGLPVRRRPPRYIVFLVDVSGSMAGPRIKAAVDGVRSIIETRLSDDDLVCVRTFSDDLRTVVKPCPKYMIDLGRLGENLISAAADGMSTALYKSVIQVVNDMPWDRKYRHHQKFMLVLSDGADNVSAKAINPVTSIDVRSQLERPGVANFHAVLIGVALGPTERAIMQDWCSPQHCEYLDCGDEPSSIRAALLEAGSRMDICLTVTTDAHGAMISAGAIIADAAGASAAMAQHHMPAHVRMVTGAAASRYAPLVQWPSAGAGTTAGGAALPRPTFVGARGGVGAGGMRGVGPISGPVRATARFGVGAAAAAPAAAAPTYEASGGAGPRSGTTPRGRPGPAAARAAAAPAPTADAPAFRAGGARRRSSSNQHSRPAAAPGPAPAMPAYAAGPSSGSQHWHGHPAANHTALGGTAEEVRSSGSGHRRRRSRGRDRPGAAAAVAAADERYAPAAEESYGPAGGAHYDAPRGRATAGATPARAQSVGRSRKVSADYVGRGAGYRVQAGHPDAAGYGGRATRDGYAGHFDPRGYEDSAYRDTRAAFDDPSIYGAFEGRATPAAFDGLGYSGHPGPGGHASYAPHADHGGHGRFARHDGRAGFDGRAAAGYDGHAAFGARSGHDGRAAAGYYGHSAFGARAGHDGRAAFHAAYGDYAADLGRAAAGGGAPSHDRAAFGPAPDARAPDGRGTPGGRSTRGGRPDDGGHGDQSRPNYRRHPGAGPE